MRFKNNNNVSYGKKENYFYVNIIEDRENDNEEKKFFFVKIKEIMIIHNKKSTNIFVFFV